MIFRHILLDDLAMVPRTHPSMLKANLSDSSQEVINNEKEIRILVDLPGVKKADIALTAEACTLVIEATRRRLASDGSTAKKTRISKSFAVDHETVDMSKIKANLSDGVLTVTVPKRAKPEPRVIAITEDPHDESVSADKKDSNGNKKNVEEQEKTDPAQEPEGNKRNAGSTGHTGEKKPQKQ